ncbi:unnamed protein product, partial [marine sediment metagenome]
NLYEPVFIFGLNSDTVLNKKVPLSIKISNFGEKIYDATLRVVVKNEKNNVVMERNFSGLHLEGKNALNNICSITTNQIEKGLLSIEYHLSHKNKLIAKSMELFYSE